MTHGGFALSVVFRYFSRSIRSSPTKAGDANQGRDSPMVDGQRKLSDVRRGRNPDEPMSLTDTTAAS